MKSRDICNKKDCSGCEACYNVCPNDAITMKSDWRGFLYPKIDSNKCIDCELCVKTCPSNKPHTKFIFHESIVFVDKDKEHLACASSGGAFGVMARQIISGGGMVFGCAMDENYDVDFIAVETLDNLKKLHGSKYVQSYVGDIYRQVKNCLKQGRMALFCGCPCHVAGLKAYLHRDYDNLITMDLICHGVPSQPYFKDYVTDLLRRKKKQGITTFRFRNISETCCETQHNTLLKKVYVGFHNKDYYMTYFLWGKTYRNSCYSCRFAGGDRPGDFTIGDFWNNDNAKLPIDTSKGSSLVLFNTEKAKSFLTLFENNGSVVHLTSFEQAMGKNGGQLAHPCHNDFRSNLIYLLHKLFGVRGPKFLFAIEQQIKFRK